MSKKANRNASPPAERIAEVGPAMSALNEKQRRFVLALFDAPKSHGAVTFAARAAGYCSQTSRRQTVSQSAYQVYHRPDVQAAIAEVSQQFITVLGPHAVRALKKLLDSPTHKDHGRALGIVMDRVSPAQSTAVVKVEGEIKLSAQETAHVLARIEELAAKFSVALPAPKIIDHEAVT